MDFRGLSRRELQALCKKNKIPANMTNVAMAEALAALQFVEGLDEFLKTSQSAVELVSESPVVTRTANKATRGKATKQTLLPTQQLDSASSPTERKTCEVIYVEDETPEVHRKRATAALSRKKVTEKPTEGVQVVYNTRRSVRLVENSISKLSLEGKGTVKPVKMNELEKEIGMEEDKIDANGDNLQTIAVESSMKSKDFEVFLEKSGSESIEIQPNLKTSVLEEKMNVDSVEEECKKEAQGDYKDSVCLDDVSGLHVKDDTSSDKTDEPDDEREDEDLVNVEEKLAYRNAVSALSTMKTTPNEEVCVSNYAHMDDDLVDCTQKNEEKKETTEIKKDLDDETVGETDEADSAHLDEVLVDTAGETEKKNKTILETGIGYDNFVKVSVETYSGNFSNASSVKGVLVEGTPLNEKPRVAHKTPFSEDVVEEKKTVMDEDLVNVEEKASYLDAVSTMETTPNEKTYVSNDVHMDGDLVDCIKENEAKKETIEIKKDLVDETVGETDEADNAHLDEGLVDTAGETHEKNNTIWETGISQDKFVKTCVETSSGHFSNAPFCEDVDSNVNGVLVEGTAMDEKPLVAHETPFSVAVVEEDKTFNQKADEPDVAVALGKDLEVAEEDETPYEKTDELDDALLDNVDQEVADEKATAGSGKEHEDSYDVSEEVSSKLSDTECEIQPTNNKIESEVEKQTVEEHEVIDSKSDKSNETVDGANFGSKEQDLDEAAQLKEQDLHDASGQSDSITNREPAEEGDAVDVEHDSNDCVSPLIPTTTDMITETLPVVASDIPQSLEETPISLAPGARRIQTSPMVTESISAKFPQPTLLTSEKSSSKKQTKAQNPVLVLDINKENNNNNTSGDEVELKKTKPVEEKSNNIDENTLKNASLRQLVKKVKELDTNNKTLIRLSAKENTKNINISDEVELKKVKELDTTNKTLIRPSAKENTKNTNIGGDEVELKKTKPMEKRSNNIDENTLKKASLRQLVKMLKELDTNK